MIDIYHVAQIFLHIAIVVAGISSLWGLYFSYQAHFEPGAGKHWGFFAWLLLPVFTLSILIGVISLIVSGLNGDSQLLIGIIILFISLFGIVLLFKRKKINPERLEIFYLFSFTSIASFVFASGISFSIFFEMLSFGTVIVLFYIILLVKRNLSQRRLIADKMRLFLNTAWIGFLSISLFTLTLTEVNVLTYDKFMFTESMLALTIIFLAIFELFSRHIKNKLDNAKIINKLEANAIALLAVSIIVSFAFVSIVNAYIYLPLSLPVIFSAYAALIGIIFLILVVKYELEK